MNRYNPSGFQLLEPDFGREERIGGPEQRELEPSRSLAASAGVDEAGRLSRAATRTAARQTRERLVTSDEGDVLNLALGDQRTPHARSVQVTSALPLPRAGSPQCPVFTERFFCDCSASNRRLPATAAARRAAPGPGSGRRSARDPRSGATSARPSPNCAA